MAQGKETPAAKPRSLFLRRRFWLGLIFSVGFLVLFVWRLDFSETAAAMAAANYWWIPPAIACYFGAVLFRTLRWHFLLLPMKAVPVSRLYPIVVIGYMANNLLPVRLGELVRSYFAGAKEGLPKSAALATIMIERVFDGVFLLLLGLLVWPFVPAAGLLTGFAASVGLPETLVVLMLALPFIAALTGFFAVALFPSLGSLLVRLMLLPLPRRFRTPAERLITGFLSGFQTLRSPRQVFATALLTVPVWLMEAAMYYLIAVGFRIGQPFVSFLLTTSTSNLATSLPSSAGGVGPFEYATRLTLEAMGVLPEIAAAYAIVLHVTLLVPVTVLGLVFLWMGNISLRDVAQRSVSAAGPDRPEPLTAGEGQP